MKSCTYMFSDIERLLEFVDWLDGTTLSYEVEGYKSGFFKYYSVQVFAVQFDVACAYNYIG